MVFGSRKLCERFVQTRQIKINDQTLPFVDGVRNLGIFMDNTFRYRSHILTSLKNAYLRLKFLFPHRRVLSQEIKTMLCESLVLSCFLYCSPTFFPCLDSIHLSKIQKVQNACLRYIFGLRKFDHVSHRLKDLKWLNMKNRFVLHSVVLYHRIINLRQPTYLFEKVKFRADLLTVNVRNKNSLIITPPKHRTALFQRSFSYHIYKSYNDIPNSLKGLNLRKFKIEMRKYLWTKQNS